MASAAGKFPSVTQILKWAGIIPEMSFLSLQQREDAMRRGRYVHHGCYLLASHQGIHPSWSAAHQECAQYLSGYERFLAEHGFTLREAEKEIKLETLKVVGHVDQFGLLDDALSVVEIKTGADPDSSPLQTAAYSLAFNREVKRYVLRLPGDGTYRLIPHTDFRDAHKFRVLAQAWWIALEYGAKNEH